ncbi:MAG: Gfo/Idh/MocA family oxidoreductase [Clostridia bacterium]|nr:Gfo/Idh/MocA family oxidoreductase [Clostridia bacterium]
MSTHNTVRKYKVALAGCGRVAAKHAKALRQLNDRFQLVALVDGRQEACRDLNTEWKFGLTEDNFFDSIEAMYEAGVQPDIVSLTTPSGTHYALTRMALERGAHVLVEKPMTLDLQEARNLVSLAHELGLRIAVGHIYRFFPLVGLIRQDLAEGKYGRVLSADVRVHWGHDQAYYDQAAWRGTWLQDGGALMNQTVHALDLMIWLLGEKTVAVQGAIARLSHKMEAEDYGAAILEMTNGSLCRVEGTTNTPPKMHSASFYISTEGAEIEAGLRSGLPYIKVRDRQGKGAKAHYWRRTLAAMRKNGFGRQLKAYLNPHTGIYWDLAQALDQDIAPRADGMSGMEAVENVLGIYKSALEGGRRVSLPLDSFSLQEMRGFFRAPDESVSD